MRPTIGKRLTVLFTLGFLASGAIVQAIVFWRLNDRLDPRRNRVDRGELRDGLDLPRPDRGPQDIVLPDGRTIEEVIVEAQDQFREDTLRELAIWSGIALVVTAIFAALLGRWLASRALRPMSKITDAAHTVTASSLDTRLGWEGPDDEVAALARTIDGMLERIEDGVSAQRQFAAMASHELKTPLAAIELEADLATQDPSSTTVAELAERTGLAAGRASTLVARLLELARSQSGLHSHERLELWEIVDEVLSTRVDRATALGIRVDFEPGEGTVLGDRTLVLSLVSNLVDNGLTHNVDDGLLDVSIDTHGSEVLLRVENTGPELDAAALAEIDRAFHRGVDNPDALGHGLGLTIVRTIADRHGGSVELTPRVDGGLVVRVKLPKHSRNS